MTAEPSQTAKKMVSMAMLAQTAKQIHEAQPSCPGDNAPTSYSLRGWARGLRKDDYLTAADLMERAADELDRHSAFLRRITSAYSADVADQSDAAMLDWAADLEEAVGAALAEFTGEAAR